MIQKITNTDNLGKGVTTLSIGPAPDAVLVNDWIIITASIRGNVSLSSVKDSLGNDYSLLASAKGNGLGSEIWGVKSNFAGSPVVTATPSASATLVVPMVVYRGVSSIGITATSSGSSSQPTISLQIQDANNFVAASIAIQGTADIVNDVSGFTEIYNFTLGGGNKTNVAGAEMDNTAATAGSTVTCAENITFSSPWIATAVELRS